MFAIRPVKDEKEWFRLDVLGLRFKLFE